MFRDAKFHSTFTFQFEIENLFWWTQLTSLLFTNFFWLFIFVWFIFLIVCWHFIYVFVCLLCLYFFVCLLVYWFILFIHSHVCLCFVYLVTYLCNGIQRPSRKGRAFDATATEDRPWGGFLPMEYLAHAIAIVSHIPDFFAVVSSFFTGCEAQQQHFAQPSSFYHILPRLLFFADPRSVFGYRASLFFSPTDGVFDFHIAKERVPPATPFSFSLTIYLLRSCRLFLSLSHTFSNNAKYQSEFLKINYRIVKFSTFYWPRFGSDDFPFSFFRIQGPTACLWLAASTLPLDPGPRPNRGAEGFGGHGPHHPPGPRPIPPRAARHQLAPDRWNREFRSVTCEWEVSFTLTRNKATRHSMMVDPFCPLLSPLLSFSMRRSFVLKPQRFEAQSRFWEWPLPRVWFLFSGTCSDSSGRPSPTARGRPSKKVRSDPVWFSSALRAGRWTKIGVGLDP